VPTRKTGLHTPLSPDKILFSYRLNCSRIWFSLNCSAVDGLVKCEKWIQDDEGRSEESKTSWWLNRLIGRTKTVPIDWSYPFVENPPVCSCTHHWIGRLPCEC
jgi:hypothetical protein